MGAVSWPVVGVDGSAWWQRGGGEGGGGQEEPQSGLWWGRESIGTPPVT